MRPHRRTPTRLLCLWDSPGKNTGVWCHFLFRCMKVKSQSEVAQLCPTLCDLIDGSPPGCPIPGILQARTLEWVAISFSNAWKWDVKVKSLSRVCPSATLWTAAYQAPQSMDIKNYIVFLKNWPFYHYMIPLTCFNQLFWNSENWGIIFNCLYKYPLFS